MRLQPTAFFVLPCANSWGYIQHDILRDALSRATKLSAAAVEDRLRFVSESEAALHHFLHCSTVARSLAAGQTVAICDAGAALSDIATYAVLKSAPLPVLKEVRAPICESMRSPITADAPRPSLPGLCMCIGASTSPAVRRASVAIGAAHHARAGVMPVRASAGMATDAGGDRTSISSTTTSS